MDTNEKDAEIVRLRAALEEARREAADAWAMADAASERAKWPPCACAFDRAEDVCMVHSPVVARVTAERDAANAERDELRADLDRDVGLSLAAEARRVRAEEERDAARADAERQRRLREIVERDRATFLRERDEARTERDALARDLAAATERAEKLRDAVRQYLAAREAVDQHARLILKRDRNSEEWADEMAAKCAARDLAREWMRTVADSILVRVNAGLLSPAPAAPSPTTGGRDGK